ncbi:hypothetical protein [Chromobacterium vaccinii]|uniref:hypothetical protein n=1 Tax=Chromobacterium vaccinii TaxID=1108595 RepID=UPI0031E3718F
MPGRDHAGHFPPSSGAETFIAPPTNRSQVSMPRPAALQQDQAIPARGRPFDDDEAESVKKYMIGNYNKDHPHRH